MTALPSAIPELCDKRVILVVGKGGVGRTTVTAALAMAAAAAGRRVLACEIGEPGAHYSPLARVFGKDELPVTPVPLAPGIRGAMLYARAGHERFLRTVLPVAALVKAAMSSRALARLLDAAPSFNEMGVFYHFLDLVRETREGGDAEHELVLLDMPATGHALALAGLPDPLLELMPTGPIADAMREGQRVLYDPARTAALVVTLPETLPVNEALDLLGGLAEVRIPAGRVVVNKLPEDDLDDRERAALAPLLAGREVYGAARALSGASRAEAVARLARRAGAPVSSLPELPLEGDALVAELARRVAPRRGEAAA